MIYDRWIVVQTEFQLIEGLKDTIGAHNGHFINNIKVNEGWYSTHQTIYWIKWKPFRLKITLRCIIPRYIGDTICQIIFSFVNETVLLNLEFNFFSYPSGQSLSIKLRLQWK